jgi:hypothetical protein
MEIGWLVGWMQSYTYYTVGCKWASSLTNTIYCIAKPQQQLKTIMGKRRGYEEIRIEMHELIVGIREFRDSSSPVESNSECESQILHHLTLLLSSGRSRWYLISSSPFYRRWRSNNVDVVVDMVDVAGYPKI